MPRTARLAGLLLLCSGALVSHQLVLTAQLAPDKPQTGPFGALKWRSIGPARGGRSIAVAGRVVRPHGAVAVAPSNPDVVYIGTGESELRRNIAQGDGVYKSNDGGKTWTHAGLADSQTIANIRNS